VNTHYPKLTSQPCHKCGKNLILVNVTVAKVEGEYGEVTTSIYKCSDPACQKESEKELSQIVKRREKHEAAKQQRIDNQKERKRKK